MKYIIKISNSILIEGKVIIYSNLHIRGQINSNLPFILINPYNKVKEFLFIMNMISSLTKIYVNNLYMWFNKC